MFAEAVIFYWNLSFTGKEGFTHATKNSGDRLKKCMEHCDGKNHQEHLSKRLKIDHASSRAFSDFEDIPYNIERLRTNSDAESSGKHSCCNFTSHGIPCSATIRAVKNQSVAHSVILNYTGSNLNGCGLSGPRARKALLEFKPESFHIYQVHDNFIYLFIHGFLLNICIRNNFLMNIYLCTLVLIFIEFQFLQIGCYYVTEHYKEDSFCNFKDSDYVNGVKILVSSKLHLWSLSFTLDDALPTTDLPNCSPLDDSCPIRDVVSSKTHGELCLRVSNPDFSETCSDASLCLPANMRDILEVNMSERKDGLIKAAERPEGIAEIYSHTGDVASDSLLPDINCLLPQGYLISLQGHVVAVHNVDTHVDCQNLGNFCRSRLLSGVASTSCFHVLMDHQIVSIYYCSFSFLHVILNHNVPSPCIV